MTTTKRTTKREHFEALRAIPEVQAKTELVEFIDHELEMLARKNSNANGEKKLTATQEANNGIKETILDTLADIGHGMTISEICKAIADTNPEISNQKASALVRQLKDEGKVIRYEDKRKAYFKIA